MGLADPGAPEGGSTEATLARGGGPPRRAPARRRGGRLLRPPDDLPRRDGLPRADQLPHHLVSVVHLAGPRLGHRSLLALDGGLRLARPEGALLRPGRRAGALPRAGLD